jgi:hypothetical protein
VGHARRDLLSDALDPRYRGSGAVCPTAVPALATIRLDTALPDFATRQRGQCRGNVVLAWHGKQDLACCLRRQEREHPRGASSIQLRHRIVEQEDRLTAAALAVPGALEQSQCDGDCPLLSCRPESTQRYTIQSQFDVVAMWPMMRHSSLSVAFGPGVKGVGETGAHLILGRVVRNRLPRAVTKFERASLPGALPCSSARGRAHARNEALATVSIAP